MFKRDPHHNTLSGSSVGPWGVDRDSHTLSSTRNVLLLTWTAKSRVVRDRNR